MIFCQHDNGVVEVFDHDTYQIGHPSAQIATVRYVRALVGRCRRVVHDSDT